MDVFAADEVNGSVLDVVLGGSKLDLKPISVKPVETAEEEQVGDPQTELPGEQDTAVKGGGEDSTTLEQKLRRSTRVRRTPQRFEDLDTVLIWDPLTVEGTMESSDEE